MLIPKLSIKFTTRLQERIIWISFSSGYHYDSGVLYDTLAKTTFSYIIEMSSQSRLPVAVQVSLILDMAVIQDFG